MLILIIKVILTPIAVAADWLNIALSILMWDSRFINLNTDSLMMVWVETLNKEKNKKKNN